jgi:hypothetical protein
MSGPLLGQHVDPVTRLHVLAAAFPGSMVVEREISAPFAAVWRVIADLERMLPRYETAVASARVIDRQGERLRVRVTLAAGREEEMDARLTPGWCLMQGPSAVAAFAARSTGAGVLLAHLEYARGPASGRGRSRRAAQERLVRELEVIEELAR